VNMNAQDWDDHVSFSATHLAVSPNGKMLAVSTDGPRIVIYRIESAMAHVRVKQAMRTPVRSPADIAARIRRLDSSQQHLWATNRGVPCAVCSLGRRRHMHRRSCSSWRRIFLPCRHSKGVLW